MSEIVETLLIQLGGAHRIAAMTGAQILVDENSATLYFKRQVGAMKITHLKVIYNAASDLYDIKGFRYNRKTFACPEVTSASMVYAENLKGFCEDLTGHYFSL
jgi:hypothetical protein